MTDLLFVYGTLRAACRSAMGCEQRQILARESRLIGPGWVRGRLFDLGEYPGLVLAPDHASTDLTSAHRAGAQGADADARDHVFGDVIALTNPADSLFWLDAYEGIGLGGTVTGGLDEYQRSVVPVMQQSLRDKAQPCRAWVYCLTHIPPDAQFLPGGRWVIG